ncbi:MAG TPA: hypothetical protein VFG20_22110 [Planctomycetaceae bacterium]|nr:hypothetical protein [Planctomycetaceae bacterium]
MCGVRACGIAMLCLAASGPGLVRCEEDSADEIKAWQARRVAEFAAYEIVQQNPDKATPLQFEKTSMLSWTNPIRETAAGAVFLWTVDGRPQMIASTYPYPLGVEQELTSLSAVPLRVGAPNGETYHLKADLQWKDVPDVEPPHRQRALRLTQMRRIAERFVVKGIGENKFETRLLTQPIYRAPAEATVDNAAFVFVQGTDPEAVLLLEPSPTNGWRYALARTTTYPIAATLDDQPVWEVKSCYYTRWDDNLPFRTVQLPGAK